MTDPIKIRAQQLQGDITDIRVLMQHPMETGQRRDDKGISIAPHHIQTFVVSVNGHPLVQGQLNTSIAKNPLFAFRAKGLKPGDKLAVSWTDNLGQNRRDEIAVSQ